MLIKSIRRLAWVSGLVLASAAAAAPHKLRVSDPAVASELMANGARLIADYGSFQLLEGEFSRDAGLRVAEVQVTDEGNLIQLRARRLDTRRPEIQALRQSIIPVAGKRLRLIQFAGPVKPEWRAELAASGVQIITYVPQNAYLVYGDAAALARMKNWAGTAACVQWDGDYADEYRIDPRALPARLKGSRGGLATDRFAVQLVEDTNANPATLALIGRLALAPVEQQFRTLHFLNAIVRLPQEQLAAIAARPDVVFIQPYFQPQKWDERQDQIVAGNLSGNSPSGPGYLAWLATKGFSQTQFNASGFVVDLSDSGVDSGTNAPGHFGLFSLGNPAASNRVVYHRLEGSPNMDSTLQGCDGHGTLNAHIIGGYCDFTGFPHADSSGFRYGLGVCPFVKIGSSVVFDPLYWTSPNFANLQSKAYHDGARISNNSWGTPGAGGDYDAQAQAFDALVRDAQPDGSTFATASNQQMVIVFAAGNAGGSGTVAPPSTAKNVFTVGASENVRSLTPANGGNDSYGNDGCGESDYGADSANDVATYSSRGPCDDGRMKPDIVVPGSHVTGGVPQTSPAVTNGNGSARACFDAALIAALPGGGQCEIPVAGNTNNYFPLGQQFYSVASGTSHAAPAVAGGCALLRQYFINNSLLPPSPAMTKAYLMNAARYLNGSGANDNLWSPSQGMGALNLGMSFDGVPRILRDQVLADKFTSAGQTRVITGTVSDTGKPFRVTLAWTDAPGTPLAAQELANDLDLTVTIGGGSYKGNVFSGAYSATGGTNDTRNNVESVFLPAGVSGNFVVTITAANINSDGVPNEGPSLDQDFAVVVYNGSQTWVPVIAWHSSPVIAENCGPTNGAIDPGETVTLAVALRNVGTSDTTNLVATLLQTNGVALPSGPATYGALLAGGAAVTQAFSFTAGGLCKGSVLPVLQLQDGPTSLGTAGASLRLGAVIIGQTAATNSNNILVPQSGTQGGGWPYPSTISVSGVTGIVTKVTVTLSGLTHPYVHDINVLLVGPPGTNGTGTNVMLISNCSRIEVTNLVLTFDDAAGEQLPEGGTIISGTYQPSGFDADSEYLPGPAPNSPFGQALSLFNGRDPNGTWSLYTQDKAEPDAGNIAQGWQLSLATSNVVCCSGAILPAPFIQSILVSTGAAAMTWTAIPEQTYRVQYSTNLAATNWSDVAPDVVASNFTAHLSVATNASPRGFYRIKALGQ